ncbi:MAG: hypothetical protein AB7L91_15590 [Dehalococcoidia bacterium]
MFDDILDLFDRNRRERRNGSRPGLLGRMLGGEDDGPDSRRGRPDDRHSDDDWDDRDDVDRSRRRRDTDFGFDD